MRIRQFEPADIEAVIALWHVCGLTRPWNHPRRDAGRKLEVQRESFLVGVEADGRVVATVMGGYDGHRGWVNYLAVDPDRRRRGHGRQLMTELERRLLELGCPKINLQVEGGNDDAIRFYSALGYGTDDVVSMGLRLIADM